MGMFDNVQCRSMSCPGCGGDLDWQTKDGACELDTVFVQDIMRNRNEMRMIGGCPDCRWSVKTVITRDTSPTPGQHLQRTAEEKQARRRVETEGGLCVGGLVLGQELLSPHGVEFGEVGSEQAGTSSEAVRPSGVGAAEDGHRIGG